MRRRALHTTRNKILTVYSTPSHAAAHKDRIPLQYALNGDMAPGRVRKSNNHEERNVQTVYKKTKFQLEKPTVAQNSPLRRLVVSLRRARLKNPRTTIAPVQLVGHIPFSVSPVCGLNLSTTTKSRCRGGGRTIVVRAREHRQEGGDCCILLM